MLVRAINRVNTTCMIRLLEHYSQQFQVIIRFWANKLKQLPPNSYLLILSFFVGLATGTIAVLLKNLVHYIHSSLISRFDISNTNFLYFALPLIGIFLTVIYVRYFVKDDIGHGISRVLGAISQNRGQIKGHNNYSSVIASALTVGFGGSVGLEAPVVLTGSSIGSNMARVFGLNFKQKTLLLACGAAGAVAAIFKAPVAAVVFAIEVLMIDLTAWSVVPLLISAATAASLSYFLLGDEATFYFTLTDPIILQNLPLYLLLGILCGLFSIVFTRGTSFVERNMRRITNSWVKIAFGGTLLGFLIYLLPPLYGEGYETLRNILTDRAVDTTHGSIFYLVKDQSWGLFLFLGLVLVFKILASSVTTGSGGIGGVFAPSLFMGGITGFLTARLFNQFSFIHVSERNFALVGMAGVMAGIMHAPLTSMFLIAEITGGYGLIVPLMITSALSYLTAHYFQKHSLYTARLASRGELITHHADKNVLILMKLHTVIECDLQTISPKATLGELVEQIRTSKRNVFPVVNEKGEFVGMILLDAIRDVMFDGENYQTLLVEDLMTQPPALINLNETMYTVMQKFEQCEAWNLPVVDKKRYVGFVSKAQIFNKYRQLLVELSQD